MVSERRRDAHPADECAPVQAGERRPGTAGRNAVHVGGWRSVTADGWAAGRDAVRSCTRAGGAVGA